MPRTPRSGRAVALGLSVALAVALGLAGALAGLPRSASGPCGPGAWLSSASRGEACETLAEPERGPGRAVAASSHPPSPGARTAATAPGAEDGAEAHLAREIAAALATLRRDGPRGAPDALRTLRSAVFGAPPGAAAGAIERFLASGRDVPTGLPFEVAEGGSLAAAPTLRVALLDWLAELDPERAVGPSRAVLDARGSPDEWAVALRNLARGGADDRALVRARTEELVRDPVWASRPTAGYLEALDLVVHTGDVDLLPELADWAAGRSGPELRWAAFLAVDRLVIASPVETLTEVLEGPGWADEPRLRASFAARADVRDPAQRRLLEDYLRRPDLAADEVETFARRFPSFDRVDGPRLVTDEPPPDVADEVRRVVASRAAVEAWLADPRWAGLETPLRTARTRLAALEASARRGGWLR